MSHQEPHHRASGERASNLEETGGNAHRHRPGIERGPADPGGRQGDHVYRMTLDSGRAVTAGEGDSVFQ